jgi:hypothetical protein
MTQKSHASKSIKSVQHKKESSDYGWATIPTAGLKTLEFIQRIKESSS